MSAETTVEANLPDFIIIGAMRAGTTSLHNYFEEHPQVTMSRKKEPEYFIEANYGKGLQWYKDQFDTGKPFRGEASPNYSKADVFPGVPERIHALLPNVRLVYVVRDPVKRFLSQYTHMRARGFTVPDPETLCHSEPGLPEDYTRLSHSEPYRHMLSVSSYARQLKAFLKYFPMDQIHIVEFEKMHSDPTTQLGDLQDFLGLERSGPATLPALNRSAELGKVPQPILRTARDTLIGSWVRDKMSLKTRDRFKRLIAMPFNTKDPQFSDADIDRIKSDLQRDIDEFRAMTGLKFENWPV